MAEGRDLDIPDADALQKMSVQSASESVSSTSMSMKDHIGNIVRRLFACGFMFIGLGNSINITNRVGYMLSTKSPDLSTLSIDGYSPNQQCVDLGSSDGNQCCSYGIKNVIVQCSLRNRENFQAAVVVCILVWALVICTQIYLSTKYNTTDLRYYVSLEISKTHWATKLNCTLVFVLTLVTLIYVNTVIEDTNWEAREKQVAHVTIVLQAVLNIMSVMPLLDAKYNLKTTFMDDFPRPITLMHVIPPRIVNLFGILLDPDDVLRSVQSALIQGLINNNSEMLETLGEPDDIREIIQAMTGEQYSNKRDAKEKLTTL